MENEENLRIPLHVTVVLSPGQAREWAASRGIEPTAEAIADELRSQDLSSLFHGLTAQLFGITDK